MMEGRKDETFLMATSWVDYDFLDTYGMTLASGRSFNESYASDKDACIINESAFKDFKVGDIEKARFMEPRDSGKIHYLPVIGVVKNFNYESLRNPIGPYILKFQNENMYMGVLNCEVIGSELFQNHILLLRTSGKNLFQIIRCSIIFWMPILS